MCKYKHILFLTFFLLAPINSYSVEICFNLYIVTKQTESLSEKEIFEKQKNSLLKQIQRLEQAFNSNQKQLCSSIKARAGNLNHIPWKEAKTYSMPLDKKINESNDAYLQRLKQDAIFQIIELDKILISSPDVRKHDFLNKRPGRLLIEAEKWSAVGSENIALQAAVNNIITTLNRFDPEGVILNRERAIKGKYEKIDAASANTWENGVLTLWNDIEVQDVSVEVKNLLRFNRTQENQCIDVYSVPKGHSPSLNTKEKQTSGEWSQRGGAALSNELFPRTTAGKGHAIILTQNIRSNEYRLAHELGHILIGARNAHIGKKPTDLMFNKSMGGYFLSQDECEKINRYLKKYYQ